MTYLEQFETELADRIDSGEATDSLVRFVSEKVLESYRNGITAGNKGTQVIRKGKSRRRGVFGKPQSGKPDRTPSFERPSSQRREAGAASGDRAVRGDEWCGKCGRAGVFPDGLCPSCYDERISALPADEAQ